MADTDFTSPIRRIVYLGLLGPILGFIVWAGLRAVPGSPWHETPRLGLDLRGGVQVVLQAVPARGQTLTPLDVDRAILVMRNRIDRLGVSEHDVRRQGRDEVVIQLAGVRDAAAAARVIGEPARLEVYDLEPNLLAGPAPSLYVLLSRPGARARAGAASAWYLFGPSRRLLAGPAPSRAALLRRAGRPLLPGSRVLAVPPRAAVLTCVPSSICDTRAYYLFRRDPSRGVPELSGGDFEGSNVADFDPEAPVVPVTLTAAGARRFERLTAREARRGRARGRNQHAAVVLDGTIESILTLDYKRYPHGIAGTSIEISGGDIRELANLALVLHSGSLPAAFRQVQLTEVSATLGRGSLAEARRAALAGLLLVALVLLVLYRVLGLVAIAGLAVYAALLYDLVLRLHVTLTLPGLAGAILTIGLAADANVVVFERVKEEVRHGRAMRAAIGAGYRKGFRTIVDAHAVTAITALVLFGAASAGVRGFALMLLLGTAVSLLAAVAATRALLGLLAGFAWLGDPRLMGAHGRQRLRFLEIDFVGRRVAWLSVSAAVIAAGTVSLAVRGLHLGIDFRSGSQVTFETARPVTTEDVRGATRPVAGAGAVIQGRGGSRHGRYTSWQVRSETLSPRAKDRLEAGLRRRLGARSFGVTTISPSFSRHLVRATLWAVLGSLALIVIYLGWRFELAFALPVVVALLHDLAVTVGIYSLAGREVSGATVAALLTVLGYSIYDTIIVFDRIRENVRLLRRPTFATIVNISLWQTIRRSLTATLVTVLPVVALLLLGGPTLRDFAFAILVGVVSGAYSSLFVAAPLLGAWKRREPALRGGAVLPGARPAEPPG